MEPCPCGSGDASTACCLPVIETRLAGTAEALMRSRYTAYVMGNAAYLLDCWHPDTRPASLELDSKQKWLGLKIRRVAQGGPGDNEGVVEFVARYKIDGRGHRLHETSRFTRQDGRWLYVDGDG